MCKYASRGNTERGKEGGRELKACYASFGPCSAWISFSFPLSLTRASCIQEQGASNNDHVMLMKNVSLVFLLEEGKGNS